MLKLKDSQGFCREDDDEATMILEDYFSTLFQSINLSEKKIEAATSGLETRLLVEDLKIIN